MLIGDRIRQVREKKRLTQEQLGMVVGVTDSAVNQWERHKSLPKGSTLPKVADALGVTMAWLLQGDTPPTPHATNSVAAFLKRDLPVYGGTVGGDGLVMLNHGDEIDRVHRPAALENVRDAFGLVVAGDSMEPMYTLGDIVYVHPGKPAVPRRGVVIEFHDGHAELKEFISQDDATIKCRQHNPPKDVRYRRADVKRLFRVIGTVEYA